MSEMADESVILHSLLATPDKRLRPSAKLFHKTVLANGCTPYVKTIYIGYEWQGEMVAALYPHVESLEIALAIGEDTPGPMLEDATHLTWRTMPLAARVKEADQIEYVIDLFYQALEGVKSGDHGVHRDNEHFIKSRRERDQRRSE